MQDNNSEPDYESDQDLDNESENGSDSSYLSDNDSDNEYMANVNNELEEDNISSSSKYKMYPSVTWFCKSFKYKL